MDPVAAIADAWGWTGIRPIELVAENAFGNLIVRDQEGRFWRITPEELSCEIVANSQSELDHLFQQPDFRTNWDMVALVEVASASLGSLPKGCKYCLKIPAVLGGEYDSANFGCISEIELILASGDMAKQIANLPDGTPVQFRITE